MDSESVQKHDHDGGVETEALINLLPEEILERIFSFTSQYQDYINIGLVCKKWHRIIVGLIELNKTTFESCFHTGEIEWQCVSDENDPINSSSHPQHRHSHSCAILGHNLYVFGGLSPTSTAYNDLWSFDLNTKRWMRPATSGSYPSPKAAATLLTRDSTKELILYGGYSHPFSYPFNQQINFFDEFHSFSTRKNSWQSHVFAQESPKLAGHSASIVRNYLILFGGCNTNLGNKSNSVYCLGKWIGFGLYLDVIRINLSEYQDLETSTWINPPNPNPVWSRPANVSPSTVLIEGARPEARYGHSQITLDSERILVVGGCGGPNKQFNDAWILHWPLDLSTNPYWERVLVRNNINAPSLSQLYCIPYIQCGGDKLVTFGKARNSASNSISLAFGDQIGADDVKQPMTIYGAVKQARLRVCSCSDPIPVQHVVEEPKPPKIEPKTNPISKGAFGTGEIFLNKSQINRVKRLEVLKKLADKFNHPSSKVRSEDFRTTLERTKQQRRCVVHSRLMQVFVLDISQCLSNSEKPSVRWQTPIAHFSNAPPETVLYSLAYGKEEIVLFGGMEIDSGTPSGVRPSFGNQRHPVSNKVFVMKPRQLFNLNTPIVYSSDSV